MRSNRCFQKLVELTDVIESSTEAHRLSTPVKGGTCGLRVCVNHGQELFIVAQVLDHLPGEAHVRYADVGKVVD